jgi:beta-lactamase class A
MSANLGKNCQIDAVEPGFSIVIGKVVILPSQEGISCQKDTVKQALLSFRPTLNSDFVRIEATKISPKIDNGAVSRLYGQLNKIVGDGILLKSDYSSVTIPPTEIFTWLDLVMNNGALKYSINETRASSYLYKTYLSLLTSDDKSIIASSTTGNTVQVNITNSELIADATIANVESYLEGNGDFVKVVDRQKSIDNLDLNTIEIDANLSQVIKQYAESYDGQYGVSFMELSTYGAKASYNDKTKFIAASTYKLYVAYSTLRRVEDGLWGWNDQVVGGQNLLACFDNMIVNSNNACAEALLFKIGKQNVTNEAKAIGCSDTAFNYSSIETTSADLALFLAKLQTGNILDKQASRDVLLNAMRQNVYRLGIPTGLGGIDVADKVGFLWALLHDAAIVYSPRGTYVLVIMTNNSSWSTIADLAKHIEQYLTN